MYHNNAFFCGPWSYLPSIFHLPSHLDLPLQPGLCVSAVEEEDGDAGVGEGPLGAGRGRRHPRRRPRAGVQVGHAAADEHGGAVAAEARLDRSAFVGRIACVWPH